MRRYECFVSYWNGKEMARKHTWITYAHDEDALKDKVKALDVFMFNDSDGCLLFRNDFDALEKYQAILMDDLLDEELDAMDELFRNNSSVGIWFESLREDVLVG